MAFKLKRFLNGLTKYCGNTMAAISIFAQLLFVTMVFAQVLMRYVFNSSSLFGIEELELFPIFWMYFFGGCLTSIEKTHIECGLYNVIFKRKQLIVICEIIKQVLTIALAILACYWLLGHFRYILRNWKLTSYWRAPSVFYEGSIFIGFTLMAFISILQILEYFVDKKIAKSKLIEGGIPQ